MTTEPDTGNPLCRNPKEQRIATDRQLFDLEKAATILESHLNDSIGLKLLDKERAFQFFSYLFNLEEWASDIRLRSDAGVDRQALRQRLYIGLESTLTRCAMPLASERHS